MAQIDLKPSEEAQTWTDRGLATWLALGLCIAPMLFSLLGWRSEDHTPEIGRRVDDNGQASSRATFHPAPAQTIAKTTQLVPAEPRVIHTTTTDRTWAEAWESAMRQSRMAA